FLNRPANRAAKLISLKRWDGAGVEVVSGVELAVAEELIGTAMDLISPRAGNCIDHASRGLAIVCRVVAGDYREFLNRVHAKVAAQDAPRRAVGVVIETDAIQSIVVLLWPRAGNR